jgi:hypothetical protein
VQLPSPARRRERLREVACSGCGVATFGYASTRLCPDCREAMYEGLAARIVPTYDPAVWNAWERCSAVLSRLWGRTWEVNLESQAEG